MKKKYFLGLLLLLCIFTLTGCGSKSESGKNGGIISSKKTMTCTKEETDEDGYKSTETLVITYNSSKVLKVKSTSIDETDLEYIELQMNFGNAFAEKINGVNGMKMKYENIGDNKIKSTLEVDYEKIDPEQLKEALGDWIDEDNDDNNDNNELYAAKDMTIDEFKEENLEGYTCK